MTGRDLLTTILTDIGAIAVGESLSAAELTRGLSKINAMIESWNIQPLMMFKVTRETFTWAGGNQSRTMGSGGNFATTRPTKIVGASVVIGTTEYPVEELITAQQWQEIPDKGVSSDLIQKLYIEGTYPLETLNAWPKPQSDVTIAIYSHTPIAALTASDTIALPDGYKRTIISNGSIELAPSYGASVPAEIIKVASESLAAIKKKNKRPRYLKSDAAGLTGSGSTSKRIIGE